MPRTGHRNDRLVRGIDLLPLRDGEHQVEHYCCDMAACSCPPTHVRASLECKPVARVGGGRRLGPEMPRLAGADRCLQCGARWERRDYRTDPLVTLPSEVADDAA